MSLCTATIKCLQLFAVDPHARPFGPHSSGNGPTAVLKAHIKEANCKQEADFVQGPKVGSIWVLQYADAMAIMRCYDDSLAVNVYTVCSFRSDQVNPLQIRKSIWVRFRPQRFGSIRNVDVTGSTSSPKALLQSLSEWPLC